MAASQLFKGMFDRLGIERPGLFCFGRRTPSLWSAWLQSRLSAGRAQSYSRRVCPVLVGSWKRCLICRRKFVACLPCSRHFKYCSEGCSKTARLACKRRSNRKYSRTFNARLLKTKRQARYRRLKARIMPAEKATGQSSKANPINIKPLPDAVIRSPKNGASERLSSFPGPPSDSARVSLCHYCGTGPLWLSAASGGQKYEGSS